MLIHSFIMSDLSESIMVAHLSWVTWAIRSRSLICLEQPEQFAHGHSFVLSESLIVAHLIWTKWANEWMSDEQMSEWAMSKWANSQPWNMWGIIRIIHVLHCINWRTRKKSTPTITMCFFCPSSILCLFWCWATCLPSTFPMLYSNSNCFVPTVKQSIVFFSTIGQLKKLHIHITKKAKKNKKIEPP